MSTRLRSYSKINLGLAIGPVRSDGFHELVTLYHTLALHDLVTVSASLAASTSLRITCTHPGVPTDARNTAWRMVEEALARLGLRAEVHIDIDKRLPVQGGLGAGSANAAAALIGLERELGRELSGADRLELAAAIGSDVPLFLLGGAVLGLGRGEEVYPLPDFPAYECVVATPEVGVSTPQAFRDWDTLVGLTQAGTQKRDVGHPPDALDDRNLKLPDSSTIAGEVDGHPGVSSGSASAPSMTERYVQGPPPGLTQPPISSTLKKLSRALASAWIYARSSGVSPQRGDLAENPLLALVRTGIENDFERVVFPQYPSLGEIKRTLAAFEPEHPEQSAVYAALSGSGAAVFGLYATTEAANAAQARLGRLGVPAHRTRTLPREEYWQQMLAPLSSRL